MAVTDLVFIDTTGYHFEDYPSFLAYLTQAYQGIYGADVYLEPDSQDGQWLAIVAKALYDSAALGGATYSSFSPVTAQGVGLSRVVKINGLNRGIPTNSTAELTIVGVAGTIITNGVAQDSINQKWDLPSVVTIPGGGSITVTGTCELVGAVTAQANTINQIFTPTLGWQTVNNASEATPGAPVEIDAQLRIRQTQSTSDPSQTVFDGTIGGVENLPGVTATRGYENDTGSTDANGQPAHSIAVMVTGGDDTDIANEILVHKTPGTQTVGTTTVLVHDAHGMPINIHFYRPTPVTITVSIVGGQLPGFSSDYIPLIQQAVAAAINSGGASQGGNPIGGEVLLTKLFLPAYLAGTPAGATFDISTLEIGKNSDPVSTINIMLLFNEQAVCDPDTDVTVVIT